MKNKPVLHVCIEIEDEVVIINKKNQNLKLHGFFFK